MAKYVFWDRRSGVDRRQFNHEEVEQRRAGDRRQAPCNDYLLIIGASGLDSFELLILAPIITVLLAMMAGSYLGGF